MTAVHKPLSRPQRALLRIMAGYRNDGRHVEVSIATLAARTGYCERQVQRILKGLRDGGVISFVPRDGKSTVYDLANVTPDILSEGRSDKMSPPPEATPDKMSPVEAVNPGQNVTPLHVTPDILSPKKSLIETLTPEQEQLGDGDDDVGAREGLTDGSEPLNVFALYHQTFGQLVSSPGLADEFKDIAATYPAEWLPDAFKAAALADTKHPNYIRAVLEGRKANGGKPSPPKQAGPPVRSSARAGPSRPATPAHYKTAEPYPEDMPDIETMLLEGRLGGPPPIRKPRSLSQAGR